VEQFLINRLVLSITWALAAIPLGIAIYVALFEQRPFNWAVAGVFTAIGVGILLVGWTISYFLKRE
jgi:hypothetical protein